MKQSTDKKAKLNSELKETKQWIIIFSIFIFEVLKLEKTPIFEKTISHSIIQTQVIF